jgi:hypothetical protein
LSASNTLCCIVWNLVLSCQSHKTLT